MCHMALSCFKLLSPSILIQIDVFLKPLKGAVVLTFGAGNGPGKDQDIIQVFTEASKDTLVLNITQCLKGRVVDDYATGSVSKLLYHVTCYNIRSSLLE